MKFNINKAYSALNADKVKIGCKGYFANNVTELKSAAEKNIKNYLSKMDRVLGEGFMCRFMAEISIRMKQCRLWDFMKIMSLLAYHVMLKISSLCILYMSFLTILLTLMERPAELKNKSILVELSYSLRSNKNE